MSGTKRAGSYRALLTDPAVRRTFALVLAGRFGYAVLPLCLLFTIDHATGSFAVAATASALFGFSGLAMPVQARLLDRFGQNPVLFPYAVTVALLLGGTAALAATGCRTPAVWYLLTLLTGLSAPALGPSMRAQWRRTTTPDNRAAAYSLDATAEEVIFLAGPIASAAFLATGPAWYGVVLAALLIPVGAFGLALSPAAPPPSRVSPGSRQVAADRLGPLRAAAFRRLLASMCLGGLAASAAVTAIAAMADAAHTPSATGFVEAGAGITAVAGGLWWGRRRHRRGWRGQLSLLFVARVPLMVGCAVIPGLWGAGTLVALAGFLIAPIYVVGYLAADETTEERHHTEASTWVTALTNIGISTGTAAAGWTYAHGGALWAFLTATAALLLAAAAPLTRRSPGNDTTELAAAAAPDDRAAAVTR